MHTAYDLVSCKKIAIKRIKKDSLSSATAIKEAKILKPLVHPCIIEMIEMVNLPTELFFAMKYLPETLDERINNIGYMPEIQAKVFFPLNVQCY